MKLEEMIAEWKGDSVINDASVAKELIKTPMLHSKYLEQYVHAKASLAQSEKKYNRMAYIRKRYYRGELTKDELDNHGWEQYQGLKMSNSEFNQQMDIDPVLVDLKEKIDYYKTMVSTIEYIMKSIGSRDYTLKSVIDYQKYLSGA